MKNKVRIPVQTRARARSAHFPPQSVFGLRHEVLFVPKTHTCLAKTFASTNNRRNTSQSATPSVDVSLSANEELTPPIICSGYVMEPRPPLSTPLKQRKFVSQAGPGRDRTRRTVQNAASVPSPIGVWVMSRLACFQRDNRNRLTGRGGIDPKSHKLLSLERLITLEAGIEHCLPNRCLGYVAKPLAHTDPAKTAEICITAWIRGSVLLCHSGFGSLPNRCLGYGMKTNF
jgi:hypothetical protein